MNDELETDELVDDDFILPKKELPCQSCGRMVWCSGVTVGVWKCSRCLSNLDLIEKLQTDLAKANERADKAEAKKRL